MGDEIRLTIEQFADFLLKYFVALAAVGALAMALIELWKKMRHTRTRYHAKQVSAWIGTEQAYAQLIHLTTGVPLEKIEHHGLRAGVLWVESRQEYAVFALELERMMGHIQDAADVALNNPQRYDALYRFMTTGAEPADAEQWRREADAVPTGEHFDRPEAKKRADLYARLHQLVKRRLDAFQLYTSQRWVNWNQLAANIVGALVLLAAMIYLKRYGSAEAQALGEVSIILLSLAGGMLSPLAKDVVVALHNVRGRG